MRPHEVVVSGLLCLLVLCCWIGVAGMWRMREPIQALHYTAMPAGLGMMALTAAVFVETGFSVTSGKCVMILLLLFAANGVVAHATSRAFRARELGHWEPMPGDDVECLDGDVPGSSEKGHRS